jgi:hypothetical protein
VALSRPDQQHRQQRPDARRRQQQRPAQVRARRHAGELAGDVFEIALDQGEVGSRLVGLARG